MRRSDRVAALAAGIATAVLFGFVALPILAIFLKVSPSELVSQLGSHVARQALLVSIRSSLIAVAVIVLFGTPAAFILGTKRFRGSRVLMASSTPAAATLLQDRGLEVITVPIGEFEKLEGCVTCLSVRIPDLA